MNEPLKILLSAPIRFYNAEAEYVFRLAQALKAQGHQPSIMGLPGSPLILKAQNEGLQVIDEFELTELNPLKLPGLLTGLMACYLKHRFDIIDIHRSEGFAIQAWAAGQVGIPVIRTRADMRPVRRFWLNRYLYGKLARKVIASNKLLQEELILRLKLPRENTATVYFGLEPDELKPQKSSEQVREELGIPQSARLVGMMGRLGPVKGHGTLLEALPELVERHPDIRFLILYPDIEDSSDFLQKLEQSGHKERFSLIGPSDGLADLLAAADMGIILSTGSEAHCRVALQWMLMEKPVIGTRVGIIPEIIVHAETGFLIQPRYASTLAHCISQLIDDPARAERMGRAARHRAIENFNAHRQLKDTLDIYKSVLD